MTYSFDSLSTTAPMFGVSLSSYNRSYAQCQRNLGSTNDSNSYDDKDGGIPASLSLNLVVWAILVLLFCCINSWLRRQNRQGLLSSSHWSDAETDARDSRMASGEESQEFADVHEVQIVDEHWYSWIPALFKLRDDDIRFRCGEDATHYLSMERHLLCVLCIFTVVSIGILLPVNFTAATNIKSSGFARTTVANLPSDSPLYWLHALATVFYLLVIFAAMWKFSRRLRRFNVTGHVSRHTLLITGISEGSTADDVKQHFQEAYEDSEVVDVQMLYDVSQLTKLDNKRIKVAENYERYKAILTESGKRPMTTTGVKQLCCCIDTFDVDAIDHYNIEERRICVKCRAERESVLAEKELQRAFVTFPTSAAAQRVFDDYLILRLNMRPATSVSAEIGSSRWIVTKSSVPDNVKWENLHVGRLRWWIQFALINGGLLLFFFFFTTPAIIISSLPKLQQTLHLHLPDTATDNVVFTVYLPILTLLLLASLLPLIVSYSCHLESHWYRSNREQYMVRKTYAYLVIVIIVLPGLGLTSLDALATLKGSESLRDQLECIFLPSGGGFFVNYVIFAAFIGTAVELCRIPSIICFVWQMCRAKSKRDRVEAHKAMAVPFKYGIEYAWILTLFALCVIFSTVCPLIVPFGVVYFLLKYWVDKYNLYFATLCPKFQGTTDIHHSAVNFAFSAGVMLQFVILFYSVIRSGSASDPNEIFSLVVIVIILTACLANAFFGVFQQCTPTQHRANSADLSDASESLQVDSYKAPVLKKDFACEASDDTQGSQSPNRGYQTFHSANSHSSSGDDGSVPVDVK